MATALTEMAISSGPNIYYTEEFRNTIETHLTYLRRLSGTRIQDINPQLAYKHEFNLYSLLTELGISRWMHWIILRLNDLRSPMQYTADRLELFIPSAADIDVILNLHRTTKKIRV